MSEFTKINVYKRTGTGSGLGAIDAKSCPPELRQREFTESDRFLWRFVIVASFAPIHGNVIGGVAIALDLQSTGLEIHRKEL